MAVPSRRSCATASIAFVILFCGLAASALAQQPATSPQPAQGQTQNAQGRPRTTGTGAGPQSAPAAATAPDDVMGPGGYAVIDGKREPIPNIPMGDSEVLKRIVNEGKNHNQVMDHITYLTTNIGARLTGSSNAEAANNWTKEQFEKWGLTNVSLFKWGEIPVRFDRGPSTGRVVSLRNPGSDNPEYRTLREMEFTTLAWGAGTNGAVRGQVIKMPENLEQFEAVKDQIKGSWILLKATQPGGRRGVMGFAGGMSARQRMFADLRKKVNDGAFAAAPVEAKLEATRPAPDPNLSRFEGNASGGSIPGDGVPIVLEVNLKDPSKVAGTFGYPNYHTGPIKDATYNKDTGELKFKWESPRGESTYLLKIDGDHVNGMTPLPSGGEITITAKMSGVAEEEAKPTGPTLEERVYIAGPAGFISSSSDERIRTSSIQGWRRLEYDNLPQDVEVQVRASDYDYMNSKLADGSPIEVEFNLPHTFTKGPIPVYNTIAEIRGSTLPDEVVIISGHMDSWNGPGSLGCTDNGTGTSVTLEAARILAACKVQPKRTIRFVLWTGEEQGLLGSAGYVQSLSKEEIAKISAVFVDDGGTNYEGGLNALESMVPYLAAATAPVNGQFYSETDKKYLDVNIKRQARFNQEGASDNASFNRVGVPGFFWDEVGRADYYFGWHTQNDKLELAIPEYLVQSSTNAAVVAYQLACAPDLLPRATPPAPRDGEAPRGGGGGSGAGAN